MEAVSGVGHGVARGHGGRWWAPSSAGSSLTQLHSLETGHNEKRGPGASPRWADPRKAVPTSSAPKARNTEAGCSVNGMGRQTRTPTHGATRGETLTPEPVWVFFELYLLAGVWLRWVSTAARAFSRRGERCLLSGRGAWASGCCGSSPLEHGLRARAQQLWHRV